MPSFYNGIDCFILCSESEGLPLVLLEAGAAGLPILMSENLKSQVSLFFKKSPVFLFNSISSFSEQSEKIILDMDETRHHYIKTEYQICSILQKYAVLYSGAGRR
jgi:glycosyltransferase involved in cell wall biosynthesis